MKKIFAIFTAIFISHNIYAAPNLTAEVFMDVRSTTASNAKKEANESAMRGAVIQVLSRYSDRAIVENILMASDNSVFQNLISSTSVSGEKLSKTAYTAKFTVIMDRAAVEKWYLENNVPNFMSAADESKDKIVIYFDMPQGISSWAELNQLVRLDGDDYGLSLRSMMGSSASAYVLANKKTKFINLCAVNGWSVSTTDGVVRITK